MTEKLYKHVEKRYFTGINIHMVFKLHVYKLKKQLYLKRDRIFIRSINWVNFHNMSQGHCFCCKSSYPSITVQEIQHKCLKTALEMYTGYDVRLQFCTDWQYKILANKEMWYNIKRSKRKCLKRQNLDSIKYSKCYNRMMKHF